MNDAAFFLSHRRPIAIAAKEKGFEVCVAAPPSDRTEEIEAHGFTFYRIPISRKTSTPWTELKTLLSLVELFRHLRPDIVHSVTIKPVIYGGLASRLARVPRFIGAVSGLGHVFLSAGLRASIRRRLACFAYRLAFGGRGRTALFQNPDDLAKFVELGIVQEAKTALIRGSGVDPNVYDVGPPPSGPPIVMLASRLLREKGVPEFIEAARIVRSQGIDARFVLVGEPDEGNPSTMTRTELQEAVHRGIVEWWGHQSDMVQVLRQASIFCLPSHGEGLPRVLLEAASCRRAIVATDVPGCREVVSHGHSGYLVPIRSPLDLAEKIAALIFDRDLASRFGENSRRRVQREFSLDIVVAEHVELYGMELPGACMPRADGNA